MPLQVSPLYLDQFHPDNGLFLLLVVASTSCFIKSAETEEKAEGVRCVGAPHYKLFEKVFPYVGGTMGLTNVRAVPFEGPKGFAGMKLDVT